MIPLRDDNPTKTVAFVTMLLLAGNALIFVYRIARPGQQMVSAFFADFALVPVELLQTPSPHTVGTVFTSMFLHAGWLHLLGNLLFLWIFGNNVEDSVGHLRFIVFYLFCGTVAAATQIAMDPASRVPMVGASGAVSGVLGAYLLLFPRARVLVLVPIWIFLKTVLVPAWVLLLVWFGLQLLSGTLLPASGIAFWAHIGGFIAGMLLIPIFKKRGVKLLR